MNFRLIENYYTVKDGQYHFNDNNCAYAIEMETFCNTKVNELLCMQIFGEDYIVISGFNDVCDGDLYAISWNDTEYIYKLSLLLENLKISDVGVCDIIFSELQKLRCEPLQLNKYTPEMFPYKKKDMYGFINDIKEVAERLLSDYLKNYDGYAAYLEKPYILGGRNKDCYEIGETSLYKIKAILIERYK